MYFARRAHRAAQNDGDALQPREQAPAAKTLLTIFERRIPGKRREKRHVPAKKTLHLNHEETEAVQIGRDARFGLLDMVEALLLFLFPATMAFAASSDLLTMKIPNQLTIGVAVAYVALALMTKSPAGVIGLHAACGALVLAITFGMFCMGWVGGGDAKLASATALWFGWSMLLEYVLLASVLGGALTLAILFARQFPLPASLVRQDWISRLHDPKTGIPYGIALAAAALILYPHTDIWTTTLRSAN